MTPARPPAKSRPVCQARLPDLPLFFPPECLRAGRHFMFDPPNSFLLFFGFFGRPVFHFFDAGEFFATCMSGFHFSDEFCAGVRHRPPLLAPFFPCCFVRVHPFDDGIEPGPSSRLSHRTIAFSPFGKQFDAPPSLPRFIDGKDWTTCVQFETFPYRTSPSFAHRATV